MKHRSVLVISVAGYEAWYVEGEEAYRADHPKNPSDRSEYLKVDQAKSLEEQFRESRIRGDSVKVVELGMKPGHYYPRMARPTAGPIMTPKRAPRFFPREGLYEIEIAGTIGQLLSLKSRLAEICQTVEPVGDNLKAFGHRIRECILIASMEVEAHCKGILRANGIRRSQLSTKDYVLVKEPLKLASYEVRFSSYPNVASVSPFRQWNAAQPTKSLGFYDAYNRIKHNRETEFSSGTLRHALEAVAACYILSIAQFGRQTIESRSQVLAEYFALERAHVWPAHEFYVQERDQIEAQPMNFPFKA